MKPNAAVEHIMQREFASVRSDERLDFVDDVMALGRVRHMPVVDDGKLVGVVSQRDLLAAALSRVLDFDAQERRTFLRSVDVREVMAGRPRRRRCCCATRSVACRWWARGARRSAW